MVDGWQYGAVWSGVKPRRSLQTYRKQYLSPIWLSYYKPPIHKNILFLCQVKNQFSLVYIFDRVWTRMFYMTICWPGGSCHPPILDTFEGATVVDSQHSCPYLKGNASMRYLKVPHRSSCRTQQTASTCVGLSSLLNNMCSFVCYSSE